MTTIELEKEVSLLRTEINALKKEMEFNKSDIKDIKRQPIGDLSNQLSKISGSVVSDVTGTPNSGDAGTDTIITNLMGSINTSNDIITELKNYCNKLYENLRAQ